MKIPWSVLQAVTILAAEQVAKLATSVLQKADCHQQGLS